MKKRILKHKVIRDDIFRSTVLVYTGGSKEAIIASMRKKHNIKCDETLFENYCGLCVELYDSDGITLWLIWVEDEKDWRTLVHECGHLVFKVLHHRGVTSTYDNNETFCYLLDYYVAEIYKVMRS